MFGNIMDAVKSNLITGGAYQLIAKAIFITLIITVLAWVIAAAGGAIFSYFMCYRQKVITVVSESLAFVFRATPVLLMLLSMYYGIFRSMHLPAVLISALAIGVYGAGHVSEILMKAVKEAAEWEDREVRRRLQKAFFTVALPQASESSLFQLKRLSIQLLQWSTVVGYIGVNDLTEVMQQIGQRSMYPFFSITFSIILYLIATLLIEAVFTLIEKKLKKREEVEED